MTKQKNKKAHSSYWTGDLWGDSNRKFLTNSDAKNHDLIKLAKTKRAIANFVSISTRQNIPVVFNDLGDSYTDGQRVVLSTTFNTPHDFDVASGLALHEAMHIVHSDFDLLKNLEARAPRNLVKLAVDKNIVNWIPILKDCLNYVEDRWIDYKNYKAAPGYRVYYEAMYNKYFWSKKTDLGLKSEAYRTETLKSYMFRLINLHNKNTDLSALNGLRDIMIAMDFKNMDRFNSTEDTFKVACKIFGIIIENIDVDQQQEENDKKEKGEGDGEGQGSGGSGSGQGENDSEETMTDEQFDELMEQLENDDDDGEDGQGGGDDDDSKEGKPLKLTPEQLSKLEEKLQEQVEKQRKFMDGDVEKEGLDSQDKQEIEQINKSGTEIKSVGENTGLPRNVDVIVVKKLTKSLMDSSSFPMSESYGEMEEAVLSGLRLGKRLGKKLLTRSESRTTVFNRQKVGRIDKRMIAGLGYGNENVFQFTDVDEYNNANLHVSIDASGSMGGSKWEKTITNITALCKAIDMIPTLDIQVTFRTTKAGKPYVVKAYDSREDKISKVKQLFPYLTVNGTTPEGLCFEAIMKDFLRGSGTMDSYFLNISDGEPWFNAQGVCYSDDPAIEHTRKMVKMIEGMGIKTLSYFIDGGYSSNLHDFKRMYGKGAQHINVTDVGQITRTMNKLFMEK